MKKKNLHIVPDDKFIDEFISILNEMDLMSENKIVVRTNPPYNYVKTPHVEGRDLEEISDNFINNYEKVFIHYANAHTRDWLNRRNFTRNALHLVFWGNEFYREGGIDFQIYCAETKKILKHIENEKETFPLALKRKYWSWQRRRQTKSILSKTSKILHFNEQEIFWITEKFKCPKTTLPFFYPIPTFPMEKEFSNTNSEKTILVGNSGHPSNNHVDIFKQYFHELNQYDRIICPLSYGDLKYINCVVELGTALFKEKFYALTTFIEFKEYARILSSLTCAVMPSLRTQGMGNIVPLLEMGKPIYMFTANPTFSFLKELEIEVFDINDLKHQFSFGDTLQKNARIASQFFSREQCKENIQRIMN